MPNNKLKEKVEALTRVVGQMLKDLQQIDSLARGTLTAFQLHIGEDDWNKVMEDLKERELEALKEDKTNDKKLDLNVE
jgi:hypothetical protein|tara:strand:+ start:265 stop:498 length:234 start_codon:yes stop_codon:yes gene_type:complete